MRTQSTTGAFMFHLSAFADEISPDLDEQIRVCKANGVSHIEQPMLPRRKVTHVGGSPTELQRAGLLKAPASTRYRVYRKR